MITERHTNLILLAVVTVFLIIEIVVTALSEGIMNLDGRVGIIDHGDLWDSLGHLSGLVYLFGDWGCHQETARSFVIGGSQMPFCIRETMMIVGVTVGCTLLVFLPVLCDNLRIAIPAAFLIGSATLFEWLAQQIIGMNNLLLVGLSGMITGIGGAALLYCLVRLEVGCLGKNK